MPMSQTLVFKNIGELMTLNGVVRKHGRGVQKKDLGIIKNAALVVHKGKVEWVGAESKLPSSWQRKKAINCGGRNLFPGFVDCHTHMVFAGDRTGEFEMRNQGKSYQQIAAEGGGILSTVRATRKTSTEDLVGLGQERVDRHLAQGVTSIEIKSGYGLNPKTELKMLEVANRLKSAKIYPTFLGAHAIPKTSAGEVPYLESLKKTLRQIKQQKLANRVDIFVEKGYFSISCARDYLTWVQDQGFDVTIHADQLNRTGATRLAIEMGAKSADHVICLNKKDKKALADSNTVAVLLPTADFYLQCDYPDARHLIDLGGCVALATDFNPGSSPTQNISMVGLLARLEMKMTLPEVFSALIYGGAKALGEENKIGSIQPGYEADFFISSWKWDRFFYDMNPLDVWKTYVNGKNVFWS